MAQILGRFRMMAVSHTTLGPWGLVRASDRTTRVFSPRRSFVVSASAQPKSPPTGYRLFQQDPKVKEEVKGLGVGELSKKVSSKWKSLTDKERQWYLDQAETLKAEYAKLNPGSVKPKKSSGRAPSGYTAFVKEKYAEVNQSLPSNAKPGDAFKQLGKEWSKLSDAQKSKYKSN